MFKERNDDDEKDNLAREKDEKMELEEDNIILEKKTKIKGVE